MLAMPCSFSGLRTLRMFRQRNSKPRVPLTSALEKVTGALVNGKNIKIGAGCVIEKLIYSGDVDISSSAVVKSSEKIN